MIGNDRIQTEVAHQAGAYSGFCSIKQLGILLLASGWDASTHLYTWVERGTVRVDCLAQKHNTMSPARVRTRTARSGVELTNHEATAPYLKGGEGLIGEFTIFYHRQSSVQCRLGAVTSLLGGYYHDE